MASHFSHRIPWAQALPKEPLSTHCSTPVTRTILPCLCDRSGVVDPQLYKLLFLLFVPIPLVLLCGFTQAPTPIFQEEGESFPRKPSHHFLICVHTVELVFCLYFVVVPGFLVHVTLQPSLASLAYHFLACLWVITSLVSFLL